MKLVVMGASGGCGKELVSQGLAAGHSIVAVGRASSEMPTGEGVDERRGDLTDPVFLASAFEGADAVLLAVGFRMGGLGPWNKPKDPTFLLRCADAVVAAATQAGVARLMAISAGGVGESFDDMPGVFKMFIRFSSLKHVYPELAKLEASLLASGLDVCIARPSGLTNGPITREVVMPTSYKGQATISRADVAGWMLEQLATEPFPHRTPLITVTGG